MRIDWRALACAEISRHVAACFENVKKCHFWGSLMKWTRARKCARAKKLSDSKWLMFVDYFYFLNHACNSKSQRYNACWRSIQNEKSAFSPFNRQGWLDRKMRFQKVSICWHFQTNQSQRVWELYWRRNNHKVTKFHNFHESEVFYFPLLQWYARNLFF